MQNAFESQDIVQQVRALARQYHVTYEPGRRDALARDITRLAGDDVELDETELLLVALARAGVLTGKEASVMQANYLRHLAP